MHLIPESTQSFIDKSPHSHPASALLKQGRLKFELTANKAVHSGAQSASVFLLGHFMLVNVWKSRSPAFRRAVLTS